MTDTSTPTTPAAPAAAKPKTVIEHMDSRRMFDTTDAAMAYVNQCGESFADFDAIPAVVNGLIEDEEGAATLDPAIYTDSMRVMVAVLAQRGAKKGEPSTAKAIVVTPAPTIDAILSDDAGRKWLEKIIDKELNHVAVRALRNADDPTTVAGDMPLTLADYVTPSRDSTGGLMESFDKLFKGIIATFAAKSPQWAKRRLIKTELKKALESKAYALEYYPELEDRGDKPSMFVMALQLGVRESEKQGLDPAIFSKWLDERDAKTLNVKTTGDEDDDFDLDDLAFESDDSEAAEA